MESTKEHQLDVQQYAEELHFNKYWSVLRRNWLPACSAFITVVLVSIVMAASQKPAYEAEGKLLFRKRDASFSLLSRGEQGPKVGELEALNSLNTPVDTEAEVIRTIPLITKTIQKLDLKDANGKPLNAEVVLKDITAKGIKGTDLLLITYKSDNPQAAAAVVNELMNAYIENTVLINRTEATTAREFISDQLPKTEAVLLEAEAKLREFREANNIVALADEAREAVRMIADLDNQLAKTRTNLADTAARSMTLVEKIGLNQQEAVALNSLSQSSGVQQALEEYQKLESQLALQRSRYQDTSPLVESLRSKEASLKALLKERIEQVLGTTQQQLPDQTFQAGELDGKFSRSLHLGELKEKLVEELVSSEVTRQGLISQISALSQIRANYQQRATILPRLEQGQEDLLRQVQTAKHNYDVLVERFQEVKIAENQKNVGNARIVSPALVPDKPTASKKKLILAGGVIAGGFLFVMVAFLMDLRDSSAKTVNDLRQLFRYTLLGLIPIFKASPTVSLRYSDPAVPELPVRDYPHSLVSESYRMLQANLKFLSPDQPLKSIVITSSVSKEGKSTVSANLAIALSELGHRTLLVDADLRYPVQHHIWQLTNAVGLSDLVVGKTEFEQAVVEVLPNLDVLPSGSIPPNPLALIDSKRMNLLSASFTQVYDFVVFDTPPLVVAADALTLSQVSDGILLVARPGVADSSSAMAAKEFLERSNQRILGLIINGVVAENEPESYLRHAKVYYQELQPKKE
jgi:polysaccharide biosynthesis transport protein